jgi:hypothetical protein
MSSRDWIAWWTVWVVLALGTALAVRIVVTHA